jgi:predicted lysophospholipase L1 biosynthesis ABC-type transport system permease subunit
LRRVPDAAAKLQALPGLAWRQGWRDFRAGELRLLMVAVMLAVAALTAVGFFASRLEAALARDAGALLGGDAVVASDKPPPPAFAERPGRWACCRPPPPAFRAWRGRWTNRAARRAWCR